MKDEIPEGLYATGLDMDTQQMFETETEMDKLNIVLGVAIIFCLSMWFLIANGYLVI